jgi:hypothetical protein
LPIQSTINEISALGQQLQPLDVAESEIRFLSASQDDLEIDHKELIDQLNVEKEDENQINSAILELYQKLRELEVKLPEFSRADIDDFNSTLIPSLQNQIDIISARDMDAHVNRELIQRNWPSEDETLQKAQQILDIIKLNADDRLKRISDVEEWHLKVCQFYT